MTYNLQIKKIIESFAEGLNPPEALSITEWSDKYRVLTGVSSSESGPWRTSRFPFLKEIMDELSPESPTQTVAVIKGAQLGFTEAAVNWMLYTIDHNPGPLMYVQKTIDTVERFSKQRLTPAIESCPSVSAKLAPEKSRGETSNTIRMKSFPGGVIILGGANSAASLRSAPIQFLILDEEDSYELDIEEEGSPSEIAIRRTSNFPNRKILRISTPTVKEISKIDALFLEGDQRRFYVPCPFCKCKQVIYWAAIKWDENGAGEPENCRMICNSCGEQIEERYKTDMLTNGEWVKERPGRSVASFQISSLYSPLGFYSWKDAATDFLKAQRNFDKAALKVFVNTVLGESWNESNRSLDSHGVEVRKENYPCDVPMDVKVLSAGVDVQDDRIEVEICGFGIAQESWSIEYAVFMGNTELHDVWNQLDLFLQKNYVHESGNNIGVSVVAVDSGHRARLVYLFCREREFRRFFPVKGRDGFGQGILHRPKKRNEDGVWLFNVYVDEVKSKVYSQLSIENAGPGYCHFPNRPEYTSDYFKMLTAEQLVTAQKGGHKKLSWYLPKGRRNEALDCRVYAIAALNILNPNFDVFNSGQQNGAGQSNLNQISNRPRVRRQGRMLSQGL